MKKKCVVVILLTITSLASFGQKEQIYCLGPGLCSLVKRMINPQYLDKLDFVELPMNYSAEAFEAHKNVFSENGFLFAYPPSGLGQWSAHMREKFYKSPHKIFIVRQGEFLPIVYKHWSDEASFKKMHTENNPFLAFYFYPLALTNTSLDIFVHLKAHTPFSRKEIPNLFEIDKFTYDFESCLTEQSRKHQVYYVFPDDTLSLFFRYLNIHTIVNQNVLNFEIIKRLEQARKIVFFNYKGNRDKVISTYTKARVSFWDWEVFPSTPFLNPNIYLQNTILTAFNMAGLNHKEICK